MRTTIDAAGRLVVPKPLRDELGFDAGRELELRAVDGRLEVELEPRSRRGTHSTTEPARPSAASPTSSPTRR